ncbi:MAG: hypothetical protein J0I49_14295 [Pseudonocardia sp.]|uniref:hypothetical protein n=1 Tax=Pseudonocardia sp. TaxID=60912 RepID=UPI001AC74746|nr:hypothetical protein [Pseudonocardia sp.]MBN9099268.1 hypothetical protein [Pseudonocardia sp.]
MNTDTTAPTAPSGLSASSPGAGQALSWTAATDTVGVTAYDVYRSTTAAFTPSTATLVKSLGAVTTYTDTDTDTDTATGHRHRARWAPTMTSSRRGTPRAT